MAITFTFKVNKIEIAPMLGDLENVVTRVRYDYSGIDEQGNEGLFAGVTPMPSPDAENYKALSALTESDVISWLESTADKQHMQEMIVKQITAKITPKYVDTPLPWAPNEDVVEPVNTEI